MEKMSRGEFFHKRHYDVLEKYLPHYQFVLNIDADSLVLDLSKSLDPYLTPDVPDVQLHMHESGEVTASIYLIRNSLYSRCFLRYWLTMSPPIPEYTVLKEQNKRIFFETLNYDNGDLTAALLNAVSPRLFADCMTAISELEYNFVSSLKNSYIELQIECWKQAIFRRGSELVFINDTLAAHRFLRQLKIYMPRSGFWRTHARLGRFGSWWDNLFGSCVSSDIIGHGWKAMPRVFWGTNKTCDGDSSSYLQYAVRNSNCKWLSLGEELSVARQFCLVDSPVCSSNKDLQCSAPDVSCSQAINHINLRNVNDMIGFTDLKTVFRREKIKFDPANELWWKQQICNWC